MTPERVLLAERPRASLYLRDAPEGSFVLKVLNATDPAPRDLLGLSNDLDLTHDLAIEGVGRALRKERFDGRHALVLKHVAGETLDVWARRTGRDVVEILRVAVDVALTLGELHERRIVHKDVKPSHVLYDRATGRTTLIDFSIASLVDHRTPHAPSPEALEGTLAYMSPEQTGRVNRVVDYRTDLYSFGATLYELLIGRPPFTSTDPLALLHCHIAKLAPAAHAVDPRVPETLSAIVQKLLAKDPEDRYQSALGLRRDLERCLTAIGARDGRAFTLGTDDFSGRLRIPPTLYGREREIARLRGALDAVTGDTGGGAGAIGGGIVLLTGDPGAGKSSLVDELRSLVAEAGGRFAQGKFDPLQRSTPYRALSQAFAELVGACLTEGDEALKASRARVLDALGGLGHTLSAVVPNLARLIGPQPEPPVLGAAETQHRLHYVAREFVHALGDPDRRRGPLVLFLDDLQWADAASIALLHQLVTDPARRFLFVGSYRPGEVGPEHPLTSALAALRAEHVAIDAIDVAPIGGADVEALVADALRLPRAEVAELAARVFARTHGNPFFVRQFLHRLADEGALAFDPRQARWRWSEDRVSALGATDNVVDLLAAKIRALPAESQRVLRLAACIGSRFDVETLATVASAGAEAIARHIWPAVTHGLLGPVGDAYRRVAATEAVAGDAEYVFVHDRVQQAAYAFVDEAERAAVHREIGRLLLARSRALVAGDAAADEGVFDVVHHLSRGLARGADGAAPVTAAERRELAELDLRAGKRAKSAAAYAQAYAYFEAGARLLDPSAWETDYALALALHAEAAETAYLSASYDDAVRWGEETLARGRDALDKLTAYDTLLMTAEARDRLADALAIGCAALRELGVTFPDSPKTPQIVLALARTKIALAGRRIEALVDLPAMTDPKIVAAMGLIERLVPAAFRSGSKLFPLLVFRLVNLSLRYGNVAVSSFGYAAYAITLCGVLGDFEAGYRFGKVSLALADKLGADSFQPKVLFVFNNFVRHWKEPLQASLEPLASATRIGLETGSLFEAVWACFYRSMWTFATGAELGVVDRALAEHARFLAQDEGAKNLSSLLRQVVARLASAAPAGGDATGLVGEHYDEARARERFETSSDKTEVAVFHILKLILDVLLGEPSDAVIHADEAAKFGEAITSLPFVPILEFYGALARIALHRETRDPRLLRRARKSARRLHAWAAHAPGHHAHRALLVDAEIARSTGRDASARYEHALRAARAAGILHEEAIAFERAAAFYADRGSDVVAAALLQHAVTSYRQWGAVAKVERTTRVRAGADGRASGSAPTSASHRPEPGAGIDLGSVMKASAAITSELVLARLLARLIDIAVENAGAERGALILERDGELVVAATGSAGQAASIVSAPLASRDDVCEAVVRYVARTEERLVLEDALRSGAFRHHPSVVLRRVRSVLCAPIKQQGRVVAIVYLENNVTAGAFSTGRIELLTLLASQAAIGLENARLFDNLERALGAQVELTDAHRRFVPDEFLRSLGRKRIADVALGDSVEKVMSILFADMRAFTSHVEGMRPEENIHFINTFLRHMEPPILSHGGFVDSYIGDAIMALFDCDAGRGPDGDAERTADDAVRAAVEMLRALGSLNAARAADGRRSIQIGVGINTGLLTLGTIGGHNRIKCGVIGDSVNLAARVEALTKTYGTPLLVTGHTLALARDRRAYDVRFVDRVRVVGKTEAVTLYEVFDADPAPLRDAKRAVAARYDEAVALYYDKRFALAAQAFDACRAVLPDDAVMRLFAERSLRSASAPPASLDAWTGVEDLQHK